MIEYEDLMEHQKNLFEKFEELFIASSISKYDFNGVLWALTSKYKHKKQKVENENNK